MSFFEHVPLAAPDSILGLIVAFQKDQRKNKVNLGAGQYRTEDLTTPVLPSVKAAEALLLKEEKNKEYLAIDGDPQYTDLIGELVFGQEQWRAEKPRIAAFQTVGGTGALKIAGTFLKEEMEGKIAISAPTWPNHRGVFLSCNLSVKNYPYYDLERHTLEFPQMLSFLEKCEPKTVILLHPSCHNPTGCDLSFEQWKRLCDVFKTKQLIPFFDLAYQGFSRSLDEDVESIRYFLSQGLEILVSVSNAKNFSIYGERVGALFIVSQTPKIAEHIRSRVKQIIRTTYSNPPMHGAKIVVQILSTPALRKMWKEELKEMRERINDLRQKFYEHLAASGKETQFSHLASGRGMFGYTGLNPQQVERIRTEFGIYMTSDGRINISGLNLNNIDYVVDAIVAVT